MTPSTAPLPHTLAGDDEAPSAGRTIIETRFGVMDFDLDNAIEMPHGIPGFPDKRRFGLGRLPGTSGEQFLLLQSLEDAQLSFIVLPVSLEGGPVAREDIAGGMEALGIAPDGVAVLMIVTAREEAGERLISVNLRAPIFVDTGKQRAFQHVLANTAYPVRHLISRSPIEPTEA